MKVFTSDNVRDRYSWAAVGSRVTAVAMLGLEFVFEDEDEEDMLLFGDAMFGSREPPASLGVVKQSLAFCAASFRSEPVERAAERTSSRAMRARSR